jgi:hypothetical protein
MLCIKGEIYKTAVEAAKANKVTVQTIHKWLWGSPTNNRYKPRHDCYKIPTMFKHKNKEDSRLVYHARNCALGELTPWLDGRRCFDFAKANKMLTIMNRERPNSYILVVDTL